MRLRHLQILAASILLIASAAVAGEEPPKCTATARACEQEIRQMLSGRRYLGVQISDLNPGIVIKSVNADGPAFHVDLEPGDRIVAVNGRPMLGSGVRDFKSVLGEVKDSGGLLFLIIQRRTVYRKVEVRLMPYPKAQIDKIVAAHLAQSHLLAAGQ